MGLDVEAARFLLSCKRAGVEFSSFLTLGRQYFLLGYRETRNLLREYGFDANQFPKLFERSFGMRYAEPFFDVLGVERMESIDTADYEGATVIHDLNHPLPTHLKEQFDVVCDAGTLEHIFDFATVIRNCMEMVKVGGHFIGHITSNNYFGHGFYQFSPDLLYRVFSPENGFQVVRLYAVAYSPRRPWYQVSDPAVIGSRVTLSSFFPIVLFLLAKRTSKAPVLAKLPQQSDYVTTWRNPTSGLLVSSSPTQPSLAIRAKRWALEATPRSARWLEAFMVFSKTYSFRNRRNFKPVNKRRV